MIQLSELHTLLESELDHCLLLSNILLAERNLVETKALDKLPNVLRQKADLLSVVEAGFNQRQSWLKSVGLPTSLAEFSKAFNDGNLTGWIHSTPNSISAEQCLEKWAELGAAKDKCNQQNTVNGIIITNAKKRNSEQLGILKGIRPGKTLYDAKGQSIASGGSQKSQIA